MQRLIMSCDVVVTVRHTYEAAMPAPESLLIAPVLKGVSGCRVATA